MTWFPGHNWSLFWNFNFKFHMHVVGSHEQMPIDLQRCFHTPTLFWHWIWSSNFSGTSLVCMGRNLLIFRNVTLKMATLWPYWIFWYLDSIGGMVSGELHLLALEFQFDISCACCLWLWAEAYWFSEMSLTKWLPGDHNVFIGFWTLTAVWLWISSQDTTL